MANVTYKSVTEWEWETTSYHNGRVPKMGKAERTAWRTLAERVGVERLSKDERRLYQALNRKLRYRADKQFDRGPC